MISQIAGKSVDFRCSAAAMAIVRCTQALCRLMAGYPVSAPDLRYRCRSGGVGVAVRGSADCSARSGSTRPEPKLSSRSPGASRFALPVRMRLISAGVSRGLRSSSSADDAAHLGGRDRRSGRQLVAAVRRRHQDVDARRRHRDVLAAIGADENLVVGVGRRHRDHVRIGAGKERRRLRAGVAGRGDQHDALVVGALSARSSEGSFGPAKLMLMMRAPWFTAQSMPLRMLNVVLSALAGLGGERVHREQAGGGRDAEEPQVRGDRAGHAGAVRVRRSPARRPR